MHLQPWEAKEHELGHTSHQGLLQVQYRILLLLVAIFVACKPSITHAVLILGHTNRSLISRLSSREHFLLKSI